MGRKIKPGDVVEITAIHSSDAHYKGRAEIIGGTGVVSIICDTLSGGWKGLGTERDINETGAREFFAVKVRRHKAQL